MRKLLQIITGLIALCGISTVNAQITVVNNGMLTIKEGQLVHINGDISNYSSLLLNQGDFRITGDFLNEVKVANPGTGIFRFIGFEAQRLTLFDTLSMFNVEVDNPTGLIFDGISNLQVFGNMNFWDGIAYTNSETMLSFQDSATTTNSNATSHINGPALKRGTADFVFPVGRDGNYRPAAISDLPGLATYRMEYFHNPYFDDIKDFNVLKVNDEGYWDLQSEDSLLYPKLTLNYDPVSDMFSNNNDIQIVHWDNLWKVIPSESDGSTPLSEITTQNRLTDFGFFTTAQKLRGPPKIDAISIAQDEDCNIRIDWVVPAGTLVETYEVEISYDSLAFTYAGEVPGDLEELTSFKTYFFIDENLHEAPTIYYRIKMVTPGATSDFTYSRVVSIENRCIFNDCVLFPNPVSSNENIKLQMFSEEDTQMPIQIWDVIGRLMFEQTLELIKGPHIYEIDTKQNRLVSGTYFLRINPKKSLKFIVISN